MISELKRKSLPEIAKRVGLENPQGLQHFLNKSPWSTQELRNRRIERLIKAIKGKKIIIIIDETGDPKKGKKTDYVARQYLGKVGKVEQGIVAVVVYGVWEGITFPIIFEVYKPKSRLRPGDKYQTKTQIAAKMVREIVGMGIEIEVVLADSLYGESESNFIKVLEKLKLNFVVSIRSNHGVWMPKGARVRTNKWRKFTRTFSNGKTETRWIREIVFGQRGERKYWEITTDTQVLPANSTYYVMSKIPGIKYHQIGDLYGCRTWVEYGFRQSKSELGWADFRLTRYEDIAKWWEIVCSAYLMVSLQNTCLNDSESESTHSSSKADLLLEIFQQHPRWHHQDGWKNWLNNLRLMVQLFVGFHLIRDGLKVLPNLHLSWQADQIFALIDFLARAACDHRDYHDFHFSSA